MIEQVPYGFNVEPIIYRRLSFKTGAEFRTFFFSDTASVHRHPANSAANPDMFEPALQRGRKNKSATYESDNEWTGESGYFGI